MNRQPVSLSKFCGTFDFKFSLLFVCLFVFLSPYTRIVIVAV